MSSTVTRPSISANEMRKADIEGLLYLYHIETSGGQHAYLYPGDSGAQTLLFDKQPYQAHPIEAGGFSWQADGETQAPFIQMALLHLPFDVDPLIDNMRGGLLTRVITFLSECDPPTGQGSGSAFPPETWQIDRLERLDDASVQLALAPVAQLDGQFLPKRVMLRDICQHRYRRWDAHAQRFDYQDTTCPYTGDDYFTEDGAQTDDPAMDKCALRLVNGCKKRFHRHLPFFGFPGLVR